MQKLIFTLLAFGGAEATLGQRLRGAAPADDAHRGLRIFLNERMGGAPGQRDGVRNGQSAKARSQRRAAQYRKALKGAAPAKAEHGDHRRLQGAAPPDPQEDDAYYHDDDYHYDTTFEDAREAFIFFVVVACLACCCFGSCAARRLAQRNYPHHDLSRPLLDETNAEVALGGAGDDWPCPVCRHSNRPSATGCDLCHLARKEAARRPDAYDLAARKTNGAPPVAKKEPPSPSLLAEFFSPQSTEDEEAPIVLTPLQQRACRRNRWRRVVEDGRAVWRSDDTLPTPLAPVVLELRAEGSVVVDADGAPADLVGSSMLGRAYATRRVLRAKRRTRARRDLSRTAPDSADSDDDDCADRLAELARASHLPFREKYLWFERELESIRSAPGDGYARLDIRRDRLLEDSVQQLLALEPTQLRRWMRVQFSDEPGIDVGGLEREWFALACAAILDSDVGVFSAASDGGLRFDAAACLPPDVGGHPRAQELYEFFGRFIGKALLERVPLDARLASPIYAQLLGRSVAFDDLACLDADLHKNLGWLLAQKEGVSSLGLDFTVAVSKRGPVGDEAVVIRELVEDGKDVPVTEANVHRYVQLLWRHHVLSEDATWYLARGLYAVLPPDLLSVFDAHELELLLCGAEEVDVDDWMKHTEYAGEYRRRGAAHPVIRWWWRAVRALEPHERAKLLQFCTGSARVPCHGFRGLQRNDGRFQRFCVQSLPRTALRFPRAHTCFNRVDLPFYASYAELAVGLRVVLAMEATGFTMD